MNDSDRCVSCGGTRRMHSRMPRTATSAEKAWCRCVPRCACAGFVMLTEWGEGDREVTRVKDASAKGSRA